LFGELSIHKKLLADLSINIKSTKHKIIHSSENLQSKSIEQSASSLFSSKQYLLKLLIDYKYEFYEYKQSSWIYSFYIYNYKTFGCLPGLPVPRLWLLTFNNYLGGSGDGDASTPSSIMLSRSTLLLKYFILSVLVAIVVIFVSDTLMYMAMFIFTAIYEIPVLKFILSFLTNGTIGFMSPSGNGGGVVGGNNGGGGLWSTLMSFMALLGLVSFGPLSMFALFLFGSTLTLVVVNLSWTFLCILASGVYFITTNADKGNNATTTDSGVKTSPPSLDNGSPNKHHHQQHHHLQEQCAHLRVRGDLCVGDYIDADQALIFTTNLNDEMDCLKRNLIAHMNTFEALHQRNQEDKSTPLSSISLKLSQLVSEQLKACKDKEEDEISEFKSLSRWCELLSKNTLIYQNNKIQHSNNRDENVIFMFLTLFISCGSYLGLVFGHIVKTYFYIHNSPDKIIEFIASTFFALSKLVMSKSFKFIFEWIPKKLKKFTSSSKRKTDRKMGISATNEVVGTVVVDGNGGEDIAPNEGSAAVSSTTDKKIVKKKLKNSAFVEVFQLLVAVGKPFVANFWNLYKPNSIVLLGILVVIASILVKHFM
jgi:hypothetical protein